MEPKLHLHLNSKQSAQVVAVIAGVSLVQFAVREFNIRKDLKNKKLDNVLIMSNPHTGAVNALTVYKNGGAKQYTWNHKK